MYSVVSNWLSKIIINTQFTIAWKEHQIVIIWAIHWTKAVLELILVQVVMEIKAHYLYIETHLDGEMNFISFSPSLPYGLVSLYLSHSFSASFLSFFLPPTAHLFSFLSWYLALAETLSQDKKLSVIRVKLLFFFFLFKWQIKTIFPSNINTK